MQTATLRAGVREMLADMHREKNPAVPPPLPTAHTEQTKSIEIVAEPIAIGNPTIFELLLKYPRQLDSRLRDRGHQLAYTPKLLMIAIVCYTLFGVAMVETLDLCRMWPQFTPIGEVLDGKQTDFIRWTQIPATASHWTIWFDGSAFKLLAAYVFGMIAAIGVCLPSFYFYSLLAMIRPTALEVTVHALRCQAVAAVTLMGILPIHIAMVMGFHVFGIGVETVKISLFIGLILPFLAGPNGLRALYGAFTQLTDRIAEPMRACRTCFVRRLLFSWSCCYGVVAPVMIHAVWQHL